MKLQGVFPPLTVPFGKDGGVDLASLRSNIERYNRTAISGYVANGSTGESVLLRWDEIYDVWRATKDAAAPGKTLIAGSGAESTAETIEHTNHAAQLGYDFALVRTPSYYKPSMTLEAEAGHYLRVADAAKIPILMYSIPAFTGYTVESPLIARVAHHPNIAGIKDSSGNVARVAEFVAAAPARFRVLVGSGSTLQASLRNGASGAILALACAFPELCCDVYEAHRNGDHASARRVQESLADPSAIVVSRYGIPGLKYALDALGYIGGASRPPLLPIDDAAKKEIDAVLAIVATVSRSGD